MTVPCRFWYCCQLSNNLLLACNSRRSSQSLSRVCARSHFSYSHPLCKLMTLRLVPYALDHWVGVGLWFNFKRRKKKKYKQHIRPPGVCVNKYSHGKKLIILVLYVAFLSPGLQWIWVSLSFALKPTIRYWNLEVEIMNELLKCANRKVSANRRDVNTPIIDS